MWQDTKNIYHLLMAVVANTRERFPAKLLKVIGITGTDGKTTTVNLIYHILQEAGLKVSMVSTINAIIDGTSYETGFHVTTPSSFALQRFIKKAKASSEYLVLEVTSHAIDQHRIWGIPFEVGVLTNITHEHLDYHKTYENYVKTKAKLLQKAKISVLNRDDESYKIISALSSKLSAHNVITYGLKDNADINPQTFPFNSNLIGEFNKYNVLAAVSACRAIGVKDEDIRKGIASFKPPLGRQEIVHDDDFTVMIDFAHTPNAFEQLLPEVKKIAKGRLIHVFGAAGKRDFTKRPLMGNASAAFADIIVLTAEDPRGESVDKIIREIASGIKNRESRIKNNTLFEIPNRQEAITKAIRLAKKGDVILITGKSHEKAMNYGHGEEPWSEYEAVEKALRTIRH